MLNKYKKNNLLKYIFLLILTNNISYARENLESETSSKVLKNLQIQRKIFIQAEEELKKNKNIKNNEAIVQKFSAQLSNYPLYPYLEFMALQQSMQDVNLDKMNNFITRYKDTPLAKPLRDAWLLHNARQKKWKYFLQGYNETENTELECYFIQAQNRFNNNLAQFDEKIKKIWLNSAAQPKSCDVVFDGWKQQGLMTRAMIWQRIKLAITANKTTFARYLALHYLPKSEHPVVELWIRVHDNPSLVTQNHYFSNNVHPAIPEILIYGILNVAKKDPEKAVKIWHVLSKIHKFTERHFHYIVRGIAVSLAKTSHPSSWEWLNKIPRDYKDQEVYNLQLVLSLKEARWDNIIEIYSNLPINFQTQEKWLYWYARALEMHNRSLDGKKILIDLSAKRSYYGFLSSAKLLRPYSFKFKPVAINSQQMNVILENKSIQRAYELLKLDRINKACHEWNLALKTMVEWELHAAAKLADSLSMPNWAITALSDAKEQDDLSLRFPKYYSQHIVNEAKKNQLDPAWVFAVTRQESAFRPNVKSYAGALGLMQLMPKTGFMVAQAININLRNHNDILDINNNVKLGSKYLQLMLGRYKNLVVATAAYNAGPSRIQKWLPNYDIAADIWVETIPFKDTREYVQNVMTYTVIYQKLLGNTHYLNMPLIKKI